jgi:Acyl-CoA dehydrogenase, C-terminal domain
MDDADLRIFERGVRDATASASGRDLDARLRDLGWHDAADEDLRAAVSVLFEAQGAANVTSGALDDLMAGALGIASDPGATAVVLPPLGTFSPPGQSSASGVSVAGLGTATARHARDVAVVIDTGAADESEEPAVALLVVPVADVEIRTVSGLDPALGLVEVASTSVDARSPSPEPGWAAALALGHRAFGHELVGASRTMLELARTHALERIQFGVPIASFQAVRHRLAESLVAIEGADAVLGAAWDDPTPVNAAIAKAYSGRAARTVARHCQQVLAGIGFTTEHPFHGYLRRVIVLDQLLGGRALTRRLGAHVLRSRGLPPALAL